MGKRAKKKMQNGSAARAGSNPTSSTSSSGSSSTGSSPSESGRLVENGGAVGNATSCPHGANLDKLRTQLAKAAVIHCQDCAKLRLAISAGKDQRKSKGGSKVARKKLPSASFGLVDDKKSNYKLWICLFCGQVGCGEWNSNALTPKSGVELSKVEAKQGIVGKGHAWQHWLQLKHPMVMLCGEEFSCWCFVCEAAHEVGHEHVVSAESGNPREVGDEHAVSVESANSPEVGPENNGSAESANPREVPEAGPENDGSAESANPREVGHEHDVSAESANLHGVGHEHNASTEAANPSSVEREEEASLPATRDVLLQQSAKLIQEKLAKQVANVRDVSPEPNNDTEDAEKPSLPVKPPLPVVHGNGVQEKFEAPKNMRVMKGLLNLGNTCFFNSVMQNLLSLQLLRSHFGPESSLPEGAVTSALRKFFVEASFHSPSDPYGLPEAGMKKGGKAGGGWSAVEGTYNPKGLFGAICSKAPRFKGFQQQDSHELLRCLLDLLHTEEEVTLKTSSNSKSGGEDALRALSETDACEDASNIPVDDAKDSTSTRQDTETTAKKDGGEQKKPETFVEQVFGGQLSSTVSCCECGYSSVVYESFLDLSLPIPSKKQPAKKVSAVANGSSATQSKTHRVQVLKNSKTRTKTEPDLDAFRSVPAGLGTPLLLLPAPPPKENNGESVNIGNNGSDSNGGWLDFVDPGTRAGEADWLDFLDDEEHADSGAVAGCAPNPECNAVVDSSSGAEPELVFGCAPNPDLMKMSSETSLVIEDKGLLGPPADVSPCSVQFEQGRDCSSGDGFPTSNGGWINQSLHIPYFEEPTGQEAVTKPVSDTKNSSMDCGAAFRGMRGQEMDIHVQMRGGSQTHASDVTEEAELNSYPISEQVIDINVSAEQPGDCSDGTVPQSDIINGPTGMVILLGPPPVDNESGDCNDGRTVQSDIINGPNGTVILLGPPVDNSFADSLSSVPLEAEYDGVGSLFEEEETNEGREYGPLPLNQNGGGYQESTYDEIVFDDVLDLSKMSSEARGDWLVSNEEGQGEEIAETSMSLEGCLQIFTRSELLSGENAWACENCTKKYHEQLALEERVIVPENSAKIVPLDTSPEKSMMKLSGMNGGSEYHDNGSSEGLSAGDSGDSYDGAEVCSNGGLPGQDSKIVKSEEVSSPGNVEVAEPELSVVCAMDGHGDRGKVDAAQYGTVLENWEERPEDNAERVDSKCSSELVDLNGAVIKGEPDAETKFSDEVSMLLDTQVANSNGGLGGGENDNDKPEAQTNASGLGNKASLGSTRNCGKVSKLKKSKSKKVAVEQKKVIKQDATKRFLISRAPPVLTVQLKRFAQDMRGRLSKLSGHIAFQELLDLHPFLDHRYVNYDCKYRLIGTVEHSGTLKSGHYVAFVRGPPAQCPNGLKNDSGTADSGASSWYYVSDSHVHQTNLEAVLQSEAYLVFYERVDTPGVSP